MSDDKNIFLNKALNHHPFDMASVEIIVPFHGEQPRVVKLIETIFATVLTNRYLITLVDDCSKNKNFLTQISDAKIPGVRCLAQKTHKGFGAAINYALANPFKKPIPWVCIMHSDVFVDDNNWLFNLGDTSVRLKNQGVRMVSPTTNNPIVDNPYLLAEKNLQKQDHILTEGFLPMYCTLALRDLFNKVGPFLECPYAGTEVEEYAIRMRAKGYKQAVCGSSWVNHHGAATLDNFAKNEKVQEILRNVREHYFPQIENEIIQE